MSLPAEALAAAIQRATSAPALVAFAQLDARTAACVLASPMLDVLVRPKRMAAQSKKDVQKGRYVWPSLGEAAWYSRARAVPHLFRTRTYKSDEEVCESIVRLLARAEDAFNHARFEENVAAARWLYAQCRGDVFATIDADSYDYLIGDGLQAINKWQTRPAAEVREALAWFTSVTHGKRHSGSAPEVAARALSAQFAPMMLVRVGLGDVEMARWMHEFGSVQRDHAVDNALFRLAVDCSITCGCDNVSDPAHVAALTWFLDTCAVSIGVAREMAFEAVKRGRCGAARLLLERTRASERRGDDLLCCLRDASRQGNLPMLSVLKEFIAEHPAADDETMRACAEYAAYALLAGQVDAASWIVRELCVLPRHFNWEVPHTSTFCTLSEAYGTGDTSKLEWLAAHAGLAAEHAAVTTQRVCIVSAGGDGGGGMQESAVAAVGPAWMRARFGDAVPAHRCRNSTVGCETPCGGVERYTHYACPDVTDGVVTAAWSHSLIGRVRRGVGMYINMAETAFDVAVAAPMPMHTLH